MNAAALIIQWEAEAAELDASATRLRDNGMLTTAATARTRRDQLNTCIEQLRATLTETGN